jgi:epoxyqueuosine reductase
LAVRSGLAKYGKNNIAYIEDWGSFHQLVGFYSDWKINEDHWQELRSLNACKTCNLCMDQYPTRAISPNIFILDTARCLTYLNESKDDIPNWVSPQAHNSLVGCMKCQLVCPYNKKIKSWIIDIGEMNQEETLLLLKSNEDNNINHKLIKKLQNIGLYEWFDRFPFARNLKLLINKFSEIL